ncbi:MAG: pilus assembly protein TadG-related protein [Alphaproteobacteria bacterium]
MKRLLQQIYSQTRIHELASSKDGAVLPIIGFAAMALFAATGMAIDMSRAQIVQTRLSNALDAAGLAAGSVANSGDINATANKYFSANFPADYMGSNINAITITPNADNSLLVLDVNGTVDTTFMRIFGFETMAVAAHSEVTRASRGMEIVMVLDNTGSMSGTPLTELKSAATTMVNILYGDDETADNLWVGLVPFAQAVNIGTSRSSWTSNPSMPSPGWGTTSWNGCVDARHTSNRDVTDDPPSVALFPKYYWPCHTTNNAWYGTNSSRNNCSTGTGLQYKSGLGATLGPNKSCSQALTPLTKYKSTVLSGINSMAARGNTHIVTGASWGWRMLSPRWRGLWGGEMNTDNLPLDYNTSLMDKVMIIMTDGANTIDNSNRGAYGYLSNGYLGTTNSTNAVNQLNSRLTTVCNSAKANDIIIYTIAFGNPGASIETLLQNCASKPEYFFDSGSGAELQSAFQQIGDSLANLRISK